MTIDELVSHIEQLSLSQMMDTRPEGTADLMGVAIILFEHYPLDVQIAVIEMLLGAILAGCEGEVSEFEERHQKILTVEDRMRVLKAGVLVIYKEALASRQHPDSPNPLRMN